MGDKDIFFSDNLLNLAARVLCCEVASKQVSVYQVLSRARTQCLWPAPYTALLLPGMGNLESVSVSQLRFSRSEVSSEDLLNV